MPWPVLDAKLAARENTRGLGRALNPKTLQAMTCPVLTSPAESTLLDLVTGSSTIVTLYGLLTLLKARS